jgi:hypothetical protein
MKECNGYYNNDELKGTRAKRSAKCLEIHELSNSERGLIEKSRLLEKVRY